MALDDHDQLQNDNGEIDVGGMWACMETWRKKKIEREEEVRESEFTKTRIFLWENVANADDIVRKLLEAEVSNSYFDNLSDMFLK